MGEKFVAAVGNACEKIILALGNAFVKMIKAVHGDRLSTKQTLNLLVDAFAIIAAVAIIAIWTFFGKSMWPGVSVFFGSLLFVAWCVWLCFSLPPNLRSLTVSDTEKATCDMADD